MIGWRVMTLKMRFCKGRIEKKLSEDLRGTRYRIEEPTRDGRLIHVICRFREDADVIIITTYAVTGDR